jgi:hypothetical protein
VSLCQYLATVAIAAVPTGHWRESVSIATVFVVAAAMPGHLQCQACMAAATASVAHICGVMLCCPVAQAFLCP